VGGAGGIGIDIAGLWAQEMRKAGLAPSFYYSLKDSFYLNAIGDNVKPPSTLLPGQVNVTQSQFEDVSVAALTELWGQYGDLAEIWFDGGISDRIKSRVVPLLQRLQPNAVAMGAGIENDPNEVDWVGTGTHRFLIAIYFLQNCYYAAQLVDLCAETGMPDYPVWSTGCNAPGAGSTGEPPDTATNFCPKDCDCTLQAPDHWFWMPSTPIKVIAPASLLTSPLFHSRPMPRSFLSRRNPKIGFFPTNEFAFATLCSDACQESRHTPNDVSPVGRAELCNGARFRRRPHGQYRPGPRRALPRVWRLDSSVLWE